MMTQFGTILPQRTRHTIVGLAAVAGLHMSLPMALAQDRAAAPEAPEGILFYDSFESGDMSATNKDGFRWGRNNRTSVVTRERVVWSNGRKDIAKPEGRDWEAKSGDHALRFNYPANEAWTEQRFSLGKGYPEVWFRYWLRVPTNFAFGANTPSNHKFFALWMDGYATKGDGPTIVGSFWRQSGNNARYTYSHAQVEGAAGHHGEHRDFIRAPEDRGRWMQVVLYAKASSAPGVSDGVTRIWRRWAGEDTFEKISESVGRGYHPPKAEPGGWANGYILGWANATYPEPTEWLLDDFTVSTQSLLDVDDRNSATHRQGETIL